MESLNLARLAMRMIKTMRAAIGLATDPCKALLIKTVKLCRIKGLDFRKRKAGHMGRLIVLATMAIMRFQRARKTITYNF